MIRRLLGRSPAGTNETDSTESLRAEVERLRAQNDKLRRAMRHCIDCEYRIEVIARRSEQGQTAAGIGQPGGMP